MKVKSKKMENLKQKRKESDTGKTKRVRRDEKGEARKARRVRQREKSETGKTR